MVIRENGIVFSISAIKILNPIFKRIRMNRVLKALVILCILAINVNCKDEEKDERPKTFRRLIPADVLREKERLNTKKKLFTSTNWGKIPLEKPYTFQYRKSLSLVKSFYVLDFPGVCFASTRCATVEPGETWELAPFCGRSTCQKTESEQEGQYYLFEMVEDCGPLPKANPKCKLSEKTNKTAPFPDCCPIFECEPGVKLEYPEIPVVNAQAGQSTTAKPQNKS
ncbi:hypothetical protein PGB90_009384 [Kerria lacca]